MYCSKNVRKAAIVSNWLSQGPESEAFLALRADRLYSALLNDVDTPYAAGCRLANRIGTAHSELNPYPDPREYDDPVVFHGDYQIYNLFRKSSVVWKTPGKPKEAAMRAFIDAELLCMGTNRRLSSMPLDCIGGAVGQVFHLAKRKIESILGTIPSYEELNPRFGPGSTYDIKRRTTAFDKLVENVTVSSHTLEHAEKLLMTCPGIMGLWDKKTIQNADQLDFVPKTAATDRPIAVGPTLNVFGQAALGGVIRSRLKAAGINLNRLPDIHRARAKVASLDKACATIDLRSASDTISVMAVFQLLPEDWFDLLWAWRSQAYEIDGKCYKYHKMSAMGNGYTFELESMIFYAVAWAASVVSETDTRLVSSFGDDILCPTGAVDLLLACLPAAGFMVNVEKSFYGSTSFRESCGGDFFEGIDVACFRFKKADDLCLSGLVRLHNWLIRTGWRFRYKKLYQQVRKELTPSIIEFLRGPDDGTDDHIIDLSAGFNLHYNTVSNVIEREPFSLYSSTRMRAFLLYRLYAKDLTVLQYDTWDEADYRRRCGLPSADTCEARTSRTPTRDTVVRVEVRKRRLTPNG